MTRWTPSAEELAVIAANTNTDAARILHRAKRTIAAAREAAGLPNPAPSVPQRDDDERTAGISRIWPIEVALQANPDHFDSDLWKTLEDLQAHMRSLDTEQAEVDVAIEDDKPVMVVWLSDCHVGHTECDMPRLRRDLDLLRQTEGVYVILGGDLMDNVVTSVTGRGMSHQQLTPVRIQKYLVEKMCEYLTAPKTLAMLLGNHEGWSMSSDDFDPVAHFAKTIGCAYLGAQGFVNVTLGGSEYRIGAAHQFRMRSGFNLTHQAKRLEDFMGEADITFVGHTHEGAGEMTRRRGKRKFYGQAGSYLMSSRYGKQLGFTGATSEMPGAILWPGTKKFLGFDDAFEDGLTHLKAVRS